MATKKKKTAATKKKSKRTAAKPAKKSKARKAGSTKKRKASSTRKTSASKKAKASSSGSNAAMKPPAAVRQALKKGLELRGEYGGKGLVPNTITWAQKLAKGAPITPQKARKMNAYFSRHVVDKKKGWDKPPTPGYVAWLLWGGDAGRKWVAGVVRKLDAE